MKSLLFNLLTLALLASTTQDELTSVQRDRVVTLHDGTSVMLLNDISDPNHYYYLPLSMQISKSNGLPEISLMVYRNERNDITGGILHVLMTWGLTPEQEKETQAIITQRIDSTATLRGAAELRFDPTELQFDQKNVFSKGLERSSSATIKIPTLPTHKAAASFNLSPIVATFVVNEIKKIDQSDDIHLKACYRYNVASVGGIVNSRVELRGEAQVSLSVWIKALKNHKLIRNVRV